MRLYLNLNYGEVIAGKEIMKVQVEQVGEDDAATYRYFVDCDEEEADILTNKLGFASEDQSSGFSSNQFTEEDLEQTEQEKQKVPDFNETIFDDSVKGAQDTYVPVELSKRKR